MMRQSVSLSVCVSVSRLRCAKTAEQIEVVVFGVETLENLNRVALDRVLFPLQ